MRMDSFGRSNDDLYSEQLTGAMKRAMRSAANGALQDLKHGLNTLATIAAIAPLLGILGTVFGISFDTFRGIGTDKATAMAAVFGGLSVACVPTAIGLAVGLEAFWCYRYFQERAATIGCQMENESVQLLNEFQRRSPRFSSPMGSAKERPTFLETFAAAASDDRCTFRRSVWAAVAVLGIAWGLELVRRFGNDALPLCAAIPAAFRFVAIAFACVCIPTYAAWVDLLHRRTASLPLAAAIVCLSWCLARVLFPTLGFL